MRSPGLRRKARTNGTRPASGTALRTGGTGGRTKLLGVRQHHDAERKLLQVRELRDY